MIPTENVVLFTLEVMVESCHLVHDGAERRATEPPCSHGAHFTGGMLWGGVTCSLEYMCSRRILTFALKL